MKPSALYVALYLTLPLLAFSRSDDHEDRPSTSFGRNLVRDIRASWHGLSARRQARRVELVKRDSPGQCALVDAVTPVVVNGTTSSSTFSEGMTSAPPGSSTAGGGSATTTRRSTTRTTSTTSLVLPTAVTSYTPPTTTSTSTSTTSSASATPSSIFTLKQSYNGSTFFNGWNFETTDNSNGFVSYQNSASAWSSGLVSINSANNAIIRVDTTPVSAGPRNSIRMSTQYTFTGGLLIGDFVHMPASACGLWPAFWTTAGTNWPLYGEIDIIEGVHWWTDDLMSLHTAPGCTISPNAGASGVSANGYNCAAEETGNAGCGFLSTAGNSYGVPFNDGGGGVYAMLWDNTGIQIFFFPRSNIPSDITADRPLPQNWGTPAARFPSTNCNPWEYNANHAIILNINLCGDLGGAASWAAGFVNGQQASCLSSTGAATCEAFVQNNGAAFNDAYWEVKSVKLFQ